MKSWQWIALALILGTIFAMAVGCRQPVRHYKITTGTPDVWANKPKQNVEFTVEWTQ